MRGAASSRDDGVHGRAASQTASASRCSTTGSTRRRPAARRGLQLRLVPAEPDVRAGRDVQRLPRAAFAKLRAPGNAVCAQCHAPAKFDSPRPPSSPGGHRRARECATCHMPTTTYMVVDPRHDHSFRIPRPDLSVKLGTPNACNQCHTDKKPRVGGAAVQAWYPKPAGRTQRFAEAFAVATAARPARRAGLSRSSRTRASRRSPGRARCPGWAARLTPAGVAGRIKALDDADALVRSAARRRAARHRSRARAPAVAADCSTIRCAGCGWTPRAALAAGRTRG